MNHKRNAIRFFVLVFWSFVFGLAYMSISNVGNAKAVGWPTWLFFAGIAAPTIYSAIFITKNLWSIK